MKRIAFRDSASWFSVALRNSDQQDTFIGQRRTDQFNIHFFYPVIPRFNPVGVGVVHGANNPWFHPGLLGLNSFRVQ